MVLWPNGFKASRYEREDSWFDPRQNHYMVPSASGLSHRTFYARTPVRIRAGLLCSSSSIG